jgi:chaperonin cofactor prefoldin
MLALKYAFNEEESLIMKFRVMFVLISALVGGEASALFGNPTTSGAVEILMMHKAITDVDQEINDMQAMLKPGETLVQDRSIWGRLVARFSFSDAGRNPIINAYMKAYKDYMDVSEQLDKIGFVLSNFQGLTARVNELTGRIQELELDLKTIDAAIAEREALTATGQPGITTKAVGVLFAKIGMGQTVRDYDLGNRLHAISKGVPLLRESRKKYIEELEKLKIEQKGINDLLEELDKVVANKNAISSLLAKGRGAMSAVMGAVSGVGAWLIGKKAEPVVTSQRVDYSPQDRAAIEKKRTDLMAIKIKRKVAYDDAFQVMKKTYEPQAGFLTEKRATLVQNLRSLCGKKTPESCVSDALDFVKGQTKNVGVCEGIEQDWDLVDMMGCLMAYETTSKCKKGATMETADCQDAILHDLQSKFSRSPKKFATCKTTPLKSPSDLADCALGCTFVGQVAATQFNA